MEAAPAATAVPSSGDVAERAPLPIWADLVCGSLSGAAGKLMEYPFDTVKVLLQTAPKGKYPSGALLGGAIHCGRETVARSGFLSLYSGLSVPLVGAMLENATLFAAYGVAKKGVAALAYDGDAAATERSMLALAVAGAGSGVGVSFVLTPVELVKIRLQAQLSGEKPADGSKRYAGPLDVIRRTLAADGVKGARMLSLLACLLACCPPLLLLLLTRGRAESQDFGRGTARC